MDTPTPRSTPPHSGDRSAHDTDEAYLHALLTQAGAAALDAFGTSTPDAKADGSVVTEADRVSERIIVAGLHARWPQDAVVGEEGARLPGGTGTRWLVDPIDGTAAFVEGLAHWGPTVARVRGGEVTHGALLLPRTGDWFYHQTGAPPTRNGTPLAALGEGHVGRREVLYVPSRLHQHMRLDWPGKARNLGSHSAHLCLVASGAAQAALIGPGWSPWDVATGLALIWAAGGVVMRLPDGQPLHLDADVGAPFIAGTKSATTWLLQPDRLRPHA